MNAVADAWDAFMRALAETSELHRRGADAHTIADLLRHARELLDIIEQGCAIEDIDDSSVIRALAARGVALSRAAWTVLGDNSEAVSDSIDDLERAVLNGD